MGQNKFGQWMTIRSSDACEHTKRRLLSRCNGLMDALHQEISFLVAEARFGINVRHSGRMKDESLQSLIRWRRIFDLAIGMDVEKETMRKGNALFTRKVLKRKPQLTWLGRRVSSLLLDVNAPQNKFITRKTFKPFGLEL